MADRTGVPALLARFDAFIRLRQDKAPINWGTYRAEALETFPNVGLILPMPYVVVDIDDAGQAERLTRLVREEGIRCQVMQTTRGRHFWFASAEPVKNSVRVTTGVGLVADYRSWGKQAQVCVKLNGVWRQWLTDHSWDEIDELPRWLRPLRQDRWKFWELGEGDGRNQALFEYQIELAKRGYSQTEAADVIRLINAYILREPLDGEELRKITREEAYPKTTGESAVSAEYDGGAPWVGPKGRFLHDMMAEALMGEFHIACRNQLLYLYRDGCYRPAENELLRRVNDLHHGATRRMREEVIDYLRVQTYVASAEIDAEETVICCRNGRLDLRAKVLLPHSPEAYDFQQINAAFDRGARCDVLDDLLLRVFCGDAELYRLFEEMLGYLLVKRCRYHKMFILVGDGSNGKSTVLRILRAFLGAGNYGSLSLQDLETTFRPAELEHKLANLGDDIPSTQIKDSSMLKKLSRGEAVVVERKNKNPFELVSYAKLIFSTNKLPPVSDKSHGLYRTLCILPFDAVFSSSDPDFDPNVEEKVTTPEAMSALLNMALRGYARLARRGDFTQPRRVRAALDAYRTESSHALRWAAETEADAESLTAKNTGELYYEFKAWCDEEGVREIPRQDTFVKDLMKRFGLTISTRRRIPGDWGKRARWLVAPSGRLDVCSVHCLPMQPELVKPTTNKGGVTG